MRAAFCLAIVLASLPIEGLAEDSLGRLFWSPEQRRALDQQRESGVSGAAPASDALPGLLPAEPSVVLSGVLRRSDGQNVVWINGRRADQVGPALRVQRGPDRQNRVRLADDDQGSNALLKPGQRWNPITGKVAECHGCTVPSLAPVPAATAATAPDTPSPEP